MYVSTIHPGFLLRCPKLPRLKSKIYGAYWTRGTRFLRLFVQRRNCTPLTKNRFGHLRTCSCGARMGRTSSTTHPRFVRKSTSRLLYNHHTDTIRCIRAESRLECWALLSIEYRRPLPCIRAEFRWMAILTAAVMRLAVQPCTHAKKERG